MDSLSNEMKRPRAEGGLAVLGADAVALREALERLFLGWAAEWGATRMLFPPLLPVELLDRIDYFKNFPHLGLMAARIDPAVIDRAYAHGGAVEAVPPEHLAQSRHALPSAACYGVYAFLAGHTLPGPVRVTTVATCFRNEANYEGLARLWSFNMREIVCVGDSAVTQEHLARAKARVLDFAHRIGLPIEIRPASDPFYEGEGSRARMAKLAPVKEEIVHRGEVAIGSFNTHRNFFGERCHIRAEGGPAFSSCVAFGLERWILALTEVFGDAEAALRAIDGR